MTSRTISQRGGRTLYEGRVNTKEMKRQCADLVAWLCRSNTCPPGTAKASIVSPSNATTDGGGIGLFAAGSPIIRNNVIRRNRAVSSHGGGIYAVNQSDALFEQNLVVDNIASDEGGGAYWLVPGNTRGPYLVNNTFVGNQAASGSALTLAGFDSASTARPACIAT